MDKGKLDSMVALARTRLQARETAEAGYQAYQLRERIAAVIGRDTLDALGGCVETSEPNIFMFLYEGRNVTITANSAGSILFAGKSGRAVISMELSLETKNKDHRIANFLARLGQTNPKE